MATFSEPERFLIKQWTDARLVEEAMKTVRNKYKSIFDQVVDEVIKNHREFNYSKKYIVPAYGHVAIAKASWPKDRWGWPTGFYVDYIQLEYLTSVEQMPPWGYVWIADERPDSKEAEEKLLGAAKAVLRAEDFAQIDHGVESSGAWLGWRLNRDELTRLLMEDEANGFISCMVDQFERMAKFTSAVDEIVTAGK
jgi:hypothetical protein